MSSGTSYVIDLPFLRAHNQAPVRSVPISQPRTTARYSVASGPLRVVCQTETTGPLYARTYQATLDGVQRTLAGFVALAEGGGSVMLLRQGARRDSAAAFVAGGVLLVDALFALGYTILAPSKSTLSDGYAEAAPVRSGMCPPGIVVTIGPRAHPVDPWGRLPPSAGAAGAAIDIGATITLGGRVSTWGPSAADRCALAQESRDPPVLPPLPTGGTWSGSIESRRAFIRGDIPAFTYVVGRMVQETYGQYPEIRNACAASIFGHASTLTEDIAAAMADHGLAADWTAESLAAHTQAVLRGAFILAKAKTTWASRSRASIT